MLSTSSQTIKKEEPDQSNKELVPHTQLDLLFSLIFFVTKVLHLAHTHPQAVCIQ